MEVRLYGEFRQLSEKLDEKSMSIGIIDVESEGIKTVKDLLQYLGIDYSDISHVFVNRKYSALEKEVGESDRVALFPNDMGLLYKWYFKKEKG